MASRKNKQPIREAIVVLGMHRSGTSAVGGVLAKLGVEPPSSLMNGDEGNPRGYWESSVITQFNDEVLASAGTAWNDWQEFNPDWIDSAVGEQYMERLAILLEKEFGEARLFFIKDPRICRLLPVWLPVLSELGISTKFAIPFRHPLEVAQSLAQRGDRFAPQYTLLKGQAQLVWLRHVLDAEFGSRKFDRAFFRYGDMLADWRRQAQRIGERLDIKWPRMSATVEVEIDGFLTADLRHHDHPETGPTGGSVVASRAVEVYQALCHLAEGDEAEEARARLDAIREELNATSALYAPVMQEVHAEVGRRLTSSARRISECEARVGELEVKNDLLKQECVVNYELAMKHKASLDDVREQFTNRESAHAVLVGRYESARDDLARALGDHAEAANASTVAKEEHASVVASFEQKVTTLETVLSATDKAARASRDEIALLGERLHLEIKTLKKEKAAADESAQERTSEIVMLTRRFVKLEESSRKELGAMSAKVRERDASITKLSSKIDVQALALDEQAVRTRALFAELDAQSRIVSQYWRELEAIRRSSRWTWPGVLRKTAGRAIQVPLTERSIQADRLLLQKSSLFDADWYLSRYPDVRKRQMDPVKHYLRYGAGEGRDPGPAFSTAGYGARYPDVAEAGINPLIHYIVHGRKEGRSIAALERRNLDEGMKHAKQN